MYEIHNNKKNIKLNFLLVFIFRVRDVRSNQRKISLDILLLIFISVCSSEVKRLKEEATRGEKKMCPINFE
jgi:hypothetical protein